jgi:hypothetical protein
MGDMCQKLFRIKANLKPNQRQSKPVLIIAVRLLLSAITNEGGWNSFIDSGGYFSPAKNKCLFSLYQVLEISTLRLIDKCTYLNLIFL